jgi:8-oxo-dGTP pyrophosphatase MutT (NUDIX family)
LSYGVHLNGLVKRPEGLFMWAGVRAADRPMPGSYDLLVSGGQPAGLGFWENLVKEAEEEASLDASIMKKVRSVGIVPASRESGRLLYRFMGVMYDVFLPPEFVPKNQDKSVDRFDLLRVKDLIKDPALLARFKIGISPILVSLLIRRGLLKPDDTPSGIYERISKTIAQGFFLC